jgi:hypothetical protein
MCHGLKPNATGPDKPEMAQLTDRDQYTALNTPRPDLLNHDPQGTGRARGLLRELGQTEALKPRHPTWIPK